MEPNWEEINKKKQIEIWRGQCWHAAVEMAKIQRRNIDSQETIDWLFATAQKLFDEGMKRGWV